MADVPLLISEEGTFIHGYVLYCEEEKWDEFLRVADEIEEAPTYYRRVAVKAYLN